MVNESLIKKEQYKIYLNYFNMCGQPITNKKMTLNQFQKEINEVVSDILKEDGIAEGVLHNCKRIQSYNNNYERNIRKLDAYKQDYSMGYSNAKRFLSKQKEEKSNTNKENTKTLILKDNDTETDFHKTKMANLYNKSPLDNVIVSLSF